MDNKHINQGGMGPPPAPGFHISPPAYSAVPQMGVPQVTVTTMNVVQVGPSPASLVCPSCHATISSRVVHEASTKTHVIAALLCLFICWPCVCLPYCMDSCQNANHYCPNCNAYLGSYKG